MCILIYMYDDDDLSIIRSYIRCFFTNQHSNVSLSLLCFLTKVVRQRHYSSHMHT